VGIAASVDACCIRGLKNRKRCFDRLSSLACCIGFEGKGVSTGSSLGLWYGSLQYIDGQLGFAVFSPGTSTPLGDRLGDRLGQAQQP